MRGRTIVVVAVGLAVVLAVFLVSCGGTTTTTAGGTATTADTSATTGTGASGADVFATVCSGCHGADGTGGIGPDLTSRTTLTRERIVDQVTNGGAKMPEYGSRLSADEITAVADYVLSDIVK